MIFIANLYVSGNFLCVLKNLTFSFVGNDEAIEQDILEWSWQFSSFAEAAEIIQTRYNDIDMQDEYYVHYDGLNRRLDEWVTKERYGLARTYPALELPRPSIS